MNRKVFMRYILLGIIIVISFDIFYQIKERFWHDDLRVNVFDIGTGNAGLVEFPKGPCMMIDCAGDYGAYFDIGESVVAPILWSKKIRTIDIVVLSHPDKDHMGGLLWIMKHFNVKEFWSTGHGEWLPMYEELLKIAKENGAIIRDYKDIAQTQTDINGVKIEIIYPPGDFAIKSKYLFKDKDTNNNSLVLRICFGQKCVLFSGDVEKKAEQYIIEQKDKTISSDIVIVPHHGSDSSSSMDFIKKVEPKWAIISVGWDNRYNFPHRAVIERYKEFGCELLRTDIKGSVTIEITPERIDVKTMK